MPPFEASATAIVPRWEWRCFAPSLAAIAQAAAMPSGAAPRESDEIYLLDQRGMQNAKIRDDVLDIKQLHQTDADGLELWEPVFKARFPLSRSDLASASAIWALPLEDMARETYTIRQFLDEVISVRSDLRVARVHKSRCSFVFGGCIAELVRLTVESRTLESFSLEHEDPRRILAALRKLGLDGHANTNYPLGLKRALGLECQTV
jgi:hypothetical protein